MASDVVPAAVGSLGYVVFTVGSDDVLVSYANSAGVKCIDEVSVRAMRTALAKAYAENPDMSARECVESAMRGAGYAKYVILHVGEICRVEL